MRFHKHKYHKQINVQLSEMTTSHIRTDNSPNDRHFMSEKTQEK